MSKITLNQFFEIYKPVKSAQGEQNFINKHKVKVSGNPEKNGDKFFKASNIKSVERNPDHGYNPGQDEKVYEEKD